MHWFRSNIILSNERVSAMRFPGGELNVRLPHNKLPPFVHIEATLKTSEDIIAMMLTVDAARRAGAKEIILKAPYLPYARQDRVCNQGEALSIVVIANLINSLRCDSVIIFDPHSDVAPALINNVKVVKIEFLIDRLPSSAIGDCLVAPDAGAEKKVRACGKALNRPVIYCAKNRDAESGIILDTSIMSGDPSGKKCLIIDDICDGGATFVSLAKLLLDQGAAEVNLFVTHGIFSKGFGPFAGLISTVYFTNSLRAEPDGPADSINLWRDAK